MTARLPVFILAVWLVPAAWPCYAAGGLVRVGLFRTLKVDRAEALCPGGVSVEPGSGTAFRPNNSRRVIVKAIGNSVLVDAGTSEPRRWQSAAVTADSGVVIVQAAGVRRELRGRVRFLARSGRLTIINELPLEHYVEGVVAREMPGSWPAEALKAQAVVVRSLAIARTGAHAREGFDLCDTTHCQVYAGASVRSAPASASVRATAGEVLLQREQAVEALFCSTCGGVSAAGYGGKRIPGAPYFAARRDTLGSSIACKDSPHAVWKTRITAAQLTAALASERRIRLSKPVSDIRIVRRDSSGRAACVEIAGAGSAAQTDGYLFWITVCRSLGWNSLKSALFEVRKDGSGFVFEGRGLGHGLGLCQWGARKRAQSGWDYRSILRFYYPGCRVGPAPVGRQLAFAGERPRARR